jgi:N6-L-threonylcarbamoyladenine synthase
MITLGIETSCDETALALIETRYFEGRFEYRVLASYIHSQAELHNQFGGVYPNLAKREHAKYLFPLFKQLLDNTSSYFEQKDQMIENQIFDQRIAEIREKYYSKNSELIDSLMNSDFLKQIRKIDRIAVTEGPGLEPALWVGITFASILSHLWNVETVAVNHMEGHILGSLLQKEENDKWQSLEKIDFPALALLISGGHTQLIEINQTADLFSYHIIGETKDDAVGEAYDKVARLMELPYPGGPQISKLADDKVVMDIKLPRPMLRSGELDFSFSGLKTAVLYTLRDQKEKVGEISLEFKKALAYEFENAVVEVLLHKSKLAIEKIGAKSFIIGGGVIANKRLRESFETLTKEYGIGLYLPTKHVSGDNALMIAISGALKKKIEHRQLIADGTKRLS